MAILTIRNLPRDVHARLRIRAARAGRSMEAEVRAILAQACASEKAASSGSALQDWVARLYGGKKPAGVVDSLIKERRRESSRE
jgi:plasmid stability protein